MKEMGNIAGCRSSKLTTIYGNPSKDKTCLFGVSMSKHKRKNYIMLPQND